MKLETTLALILAAGPLRACCRSFHWKEGDACPQEIVSDIRYANRPRSNTTAPLTQVHHALTHCPNATALSLSIGQGGYVDGGCFTGMSCEEKIWNFNFTDNEHFPALKELVIDGYDFDDRHAWDQKRSRIGYPWPSWHWEHTWWTVLTGRDMKQVFEPKPKEPEPDLSSYAEAHIRKWLSAMDWSKLEKLHIVDPSDHFLTIMANELPSLKDLKFTGWGRCCNPYNVHCSWCALHERENETVEGFLSNVGPLTSLTLENVGEPFNRLNSTLSNGCSSLRHLALNHSWGTSCSHDAPNLSQPQLTRLNEACPALTYLGINAEVNGTWPLETFSAVSKFENLESAALYLTHTEECEDLYDRYAYYQRHEYRSTPNLNTTSALSLFWYIRDRKQGVELTSLEFHDLGGRCQGDGLQIVSCSVLDAAGGRKRAGEPWCTEPDYDYWSMREWSEEDEDLVRLQQEMQM